MQLVRLNRLGLSSRPGYDPHALAWAGKVNSYGGDVSDVQLGRVSRLCVGLKACDAWALAADYWVRRAENPIQSLTSLKQCVLGQAFNNPTITPGVGVTYDGLTNYILDKWSLSANGLVLSAASQSIGIWVLSGGGGGTNTGLKGYRQGSTSNALIIRPYGSNQYCGRIQSATVVSAVTAAANPAWITLDRAGDDILFRRNGVAVEAAQSSPYGGGTSTVSVAEGGVGTGGDVVGAFVSGTVAVTKVGAGLSDVQALAEYAAVATYVNSF